MNFLLLYSKTTHVLIVDVTDGGLAGDASRISLYSTKHQSLWRNWLKRSLVPTRNLTTLTGV